jgi:hypothetical protein
VPYRSWSESRARPRTNVGLWLQAILMRDHERRDALRTTLNRGRPGWNDDEPAVVGAVFEIVMRRLFGSENEVGSVTDFVDKVRTLLEGAPHVDRLKAEALIREATGEAGLNVNGINAAERYLSQGILAASGVFVMGIVDEAAVNEIIAEGERVAFERGWAPPLARERTRD